MHPDAAVIERFYERFHARDAEGMIACYAPDVVFRDPVFGELRGERAADMWRMLTARAKDLTVEVSDVSAVDGTASARWVATYTYARGRRVRNVIDARFELADGVITRHTDSFSLWRWAGMALGPTGLILGWTPMVQARIRREATKGLDAFAAKRGAHP